MAKSGDDAAATLVLVFITIFLCIAVVLLGLAFVILIALLFLWWVLTYWLLRLVNDVLTDHLVTESEGLLALILPAVFWSILVGLVFPRPWLRAMARYLEVSTGRTWLYLIIGVSLISLGFGFMSLLMLDGGEQESTLTENEAGMIELPSGASHHSWNNGRERELLRDGVFTGEDF